MRLYIIHAHSSVVPFFSGEQYISVCTRAGNCFELPHRRSILYIRYGLFPVRGRAYYTLVGLFVLEGAAGKSFLEGVVVVAARKIFSYRCAIESTIFRDNWTRLCAKEERSDVQFDIFLLCAVNDLR